MTPERYQRLCEIFHHALDLSMTERAEFLHRACDGDPSLRREIESLLAAHSKAGSFINAPAAAELFPNETSLLKSGETIGAYEIVSFISRGGMGEVYLARDKRLERKVALKFLPPEFMQHRDRVRRFEQEARMASALNHPNIVTIHDIGVAAAGHFIVMEFVEGRTLRMLLKSEEPFDALAPLVLQIAKAVSVAHAAGITHRDLKPENIMVRNDGYVKILDFGLARLAAIPTLSSEAETAHRTQPGLLRGTVRYMSPEQARGESVGSPSDVFSLGVILYEMATGKHPFATESLFATLNAIVTERPLTPSRLNPELPPVIESLILQMIEKDARLRPTADDVVAILAVTERRVSAAAVPAKPLPHIRRSVGRDEERRQLQEIFDRITSGSGLLIGVAGEPGIGKTTFVEDFLSELTVENQRCFIGRGRCSERLAGTQAYLPWLEALETLLRVDESRSETSRPRIASSMRRLAPSWYAQVSTIAPDDSSAERLFAEGASSQERMKRELCAFLQEISKHRTVVLFFDDLHWADLSTVDLLGFLADRLDNMRLMIFVTYRPSDLLLTNHSFLQLKPDLQARGVCREISLEFLTLEDIQEYLALEFSQHLLPNELPALIHWKTEGSPLFVVDLVRYLRHRGVIQQDGAQWIMKGSLPQIERELPESMRGMIERKIAQLGEEDRRLLTVASVQGYEFDSAIVARVLEMDAADVEERLEKIERVHTFVRLIEEREFPDQTLTLRYRFVHVLYQNELYSQLRPTRKAQLSRAVAEALLNFLDQNCDAIASELARLFEAARDFSRAADYFLLAAQNAARVFAYQETIALTRRGLELLKRLRDTEERSRQELEFQITLGPALIATKGYTVAEVVQVYARARQLCEQLTESPHLFTALFNMWLIYDLRGEQRNAYDLAEQCLNFALRVEDPTLLLMSHYALGETLFFDGDFLAARQHLEKSVALYDSRQHRSLAVVYSGYDPSVFCRIIIAHILWNLGNLDQAHRRMEEAITLAKELGQAHSIVLALCHAALLHYLRREAQVAQQRAEEALRLSQEHGFVFMSHFATILCGPALVELGDWSKGIDLMNSGIASYRATGSEADRPWFVGLLAEACLKTGRIKQGLEALEEMLAYMEHNGLRVHEAELLRLKGELLLQDERIAQATDCFQNAIETAQRQHSKSLELRATISLARLLQEEGKQREAHQRLAEISGAFTEGFQTADLKQARALLAGLST